MQLNSWFSIRCFLLEWEKSHNLGKNSQKCRLHIVMRSSHLCGHVRFSLCFKTWLQTTISFLPIWHLRLNNSFLSMVTKTLLVVQAFNLRRGRKMSLISRSTQQVPGQLGLQSEILFQKENKANFYRSVSVLTFNISWQIHSAVRWQKIAYYFRLLSIMSIKSFKNFSSKSLHSPVFIYYI